MTIKYKQCPECGSMNSISILYGLPTPELFLKADIGTVKLGGCCITDDNPEYFCKDCEYVWNRKQSVNVAYGKIKSITASVGGFNGGYYAVIIDFDSLEVVWSHPYGYGKQGTIYKKFRTVTANKFLEGLNTTNLLNWQAKYWDEEILDGTQWSVEIVSEKRTIRKTGSNKFPEEWEIFCKLITDIFRVKFG